MSLVDCSGCYLFRYFTNLSRDLACSECGIMIRERVWDESRPQMNWRPPLHLLGILIGLACIDLSPTKPYPPASVFSSIARVSRSVWTSSHPPSAGRPLTNVMKPCEVNSKSHSASILTLDIRQAIPECSERESPLLVGAVFYHSIHINVPLMLPPPFTSSSYHYLRIVPTSYNTNIKNPSLPLCYPPYPSITGVFPAMIVLPRLFSSSTCSLLLLSPFCSFTGCSLFRTECGCGAGCMIFSP